jgi:hypothetical protein
MVTPLLLAALLAAASVAAPAQSAPEPVPAPPANPADAPGAKPEPVAPDAVAPKAGRPRVDPKDRLYATSEALDAKLDEVVCRVEQKTGSRLGAKRICRTRREWVAEAEQARTEMRRIDESLGASSRSD